MALEGFHPVCRIRTPTAEALPGFVFVYTRVRGTNSRDWSFYLMEVFFWRQFLFGFPDI